MKIFFICIMLSLSIPLFSATTLKSETLIQNDGKEIGEIFVSEFNNENEKKIKIDREYNYLIEKDEFVFQLIDTGVIYKGAYPTPFGYTVSFKGFYKNKYVSVYGGYENFEELKKIFFNELEKSGYKNK